MAEEKVSDTEYYFYKDLDNAFLKVVQAVNTNKSARGNVFANVMYITKQDDKKDVIIFVSKSDDEDEKGQLIYPRDQSQRMKQIEKEKLKKVYTLPNQSRDVEYSQIFFSEVYDGTIPIEPLNTFYNGKRTLTNFQNLSSYKNCDDIECIRNKTKCDNNSFFVDSFIKFSKEEDKPNTNMFCRRFGVIEITDELNNIDNYDSFVARLENEYKTNPVIASDIENNLRNIGSDRTQEFLSKYRLKYIILTDDERKIAEEIAQRDDYQTFSGMIKKYIFSDDPSKRTSGNNIKTYLKYMGSDEIKDFINRLNAELDHFYMQERERMTKLSKKEPSILEMTFSIGQKITSSMTEAIRSGRRTFRNIKQVTSPYSERLMRGGRTMMDYIGSRRRQQERRLPGPRSNPDEDLY